MKQATKTLVNAVHSSFRRITSCSLLYHCVYTMSWSKYHFWV